MSPRKLSESDKRDILYLYRQPGETTSTLAARYDVSNSTISRLLKSRLSELEYEALVQQKRSTRTQGSVDDEFETEADDGFPCAFGEGLLEPESESFTTTSTGERRRRRRSSAPQPVTETQAATEIYMQTPEIPTSAAPIDSEPLEDSYSPGTNVLEAMLDEELADLDYDDDNLEDTDDDDWEEDIESLPNQSSIIFPNKNRPNVQVLPLSTASLPKTCYLVVDRAAELIARPLKEFSDLGKIPDEEVQQKTLPVFDNHRVARRFSNRTQRVIKVPDGRMLYKVGSQLQAKGITRLLIDGQVYSL